MKIINFSIFFLLLVIQPISNFNFGQTTVKLNKISGGTIFLMLKTQYAGTTTGSDLTINDLYIVCNYGTHPLLCPTNKQHTLSTEWYQIQCSISESIAADSQCGLFGLPNIISTGDTFTPTLENAVTSEESKFGNTEISLVSVEGKKVIIKIKTQKEGTTTKDDLFVYGLEISNLELICKANEQISLSTSGTELECSANDEIDGNKWCYLQGSPSIYSTDDTFGSINLVGNNVYSSFGLVKIGLESVLGTTVTIILTPKYKGSTTFDITGLKVNEETLTCPQNVHLELIKEGTQIVCSLSHAVGDNQQCTLSSDTLYSSSFNNLVIDESKSNILAGSSKYGNTALILQSIIGTHITILIKTSFTADTQSNQFTILGLSLNSESKDYPMTCNKPEKINLKVEGTPFSCTITNVMNGGKICKLNGVPTFISEGDTFSDITLSTDTKISSFGEITISPISIIGNIAKIKLESQYGGTTPSKVNSINGLKWNNKELTCEVNNIINLSNKPEISCTLTDTMNGNINAQLEGSSPKILMEDLSEISGNIILSTYTITSYFGQLKVKINSVVGDKVIFSLESEYVGSLTGLDISGLQLNNKALICQSGSESLELKKADGTSNANIQCSFSDTNYSEESNNLCILTGSPIPSKNLFTRANITSPYQINAGIRNFGIITIYLYKIEGTTVYIQLQPSALSGKVRPIISHLSLDVGNSTYSDISCVIDDKIQLIKNSKTTVKCYISNTINTNIDCKLVEGGIVSITSSNGDIFDGIYLDAGIINPSPPKYGDISIEIINIIGTEIKLELIVSSFTIINTANPVIHGLYLGDTELYCVATQILTFSGNKATMTCTSYTTITCTSCRLTGTPTIVSFGDSQDTFGKATIIPEKTVTPRPSTLGNIDIKLDEVINTDVYINICSSNNGRDTTKVDINNLYIDGQPLTCTDNIKFSTSPTRIKCTIRDPITLDKTVQLTGTPSIKIYSEEESIDVVQIQTGSEIIKAKSNSGLIIKLISVKENFVIITIDVVEFVQKTLLNNFNLNGLTINGIPININFEEIYLGGGPVEIKAPLSEPILDNTECYLEGILTAQGTSDGKIFGPIENPTGNSVRSTSFKFGKGTLSLLGVHGYTAKIGIKSTKGALTQNTILNDLYINNIRLTCNFDDNIQFSSYETEVECQLSSPIDGSQACTLSYKGYGDDNFEEIIINEGSKSVSSTYNNFGEVVILLLSVNFKNVKIIIKTGMSGTSTTNNIIIKNLYVNNKKIECDFNEQIEFTQEGTELDCTLESDEIADTYILTAIEPEIVSFADNFGHIRIDSEHSVVRAAPKTIDEIKIILSSVAGKKVSIKIQSSDEVYTYMKIKNLQIKNTENSVIYDLICPNKYVTLTQKNDYTNYIICNISTSDKIQIGLFFTLVNAELVSIESYDNFENIIIRTDEVKSTKFGDVIINPDSLQFVIELIPTNQETTLGPINPDKLKLISSSEYALDCRTQEAIELKYSGTKLYCTIKGTISLSETENENPIIISDNNEDTFGNILFEKSFYEMKTPNCYAIYDKDSCLIHPNCEFVKETYGFCDVNYDNIYYGNNVTFTSNECILYSNEENCNNNSNCFWNEEYKYTCKPRSIKNCEKLSNTNLSICETCNKGYELNTEGTKCLLVGEAYYRCFEYSTSSTCNSKPQCEYHDESYSYCTSSDLIEANTENNCHLFITKEACNGQESCIWKTNPSKGCNEKYIENCIKLRESDPTACEKCEDGYYILGGTSCTKKSIGEDEQCEKLIDDKDNCINLPFCEYSRNAFCYGGVGCYRYLSQELCERDEFCWWNSGNWNRCKIKKIPNCLILSENDATTCDKCKDGYILKNYNTTCFKTSSDNDGEDASSCYSIMQSEESCKSNELCEYSKRHRCEAFNEDTLCLLYLDKDLCEEDQRCFWITGDETICQIKSIDNCMELNSDNIAKCKRCKDGYELGNDDTECNGNGSGTLIWNCFVFMALLMFLL